MNWVIRQYVTQPARSDIQKLTVMGQPVGQVSPFALGYLPDQQYQQAQRVIDPQQFNQVFNGQQAQPIMPSPSISPYQLILNKIQRASQPRAMPPVGLW